jgi:hypothetical protein
MDQPEQILVIAFIKPKHFFFTIELKENTKRILEGEKRLLKKATSELRRKNIARRKR